MIFILCLKTKKFSAMPLKLDPMNSEWDSSCTFSPDNFSKPPHKILFPEMLSAFEYLLVFSVSPLGQASLLLPRCSCWGPHLQRVLVLTHPGTRVWCLPRVRICVQGWEGDAWLAPWGKDHAAQLCRGVHLPVDSLGDFKLWLPYSRPTAKALPCVSLVFFGLEIHCMENSIWKKLREFLPKSYRKYSANRWVVPRDQDFILGFCSL